MRKVTVSVGNDKNNFSAIKGEDGRFAFSDVPPGQYYVAISRAGYLDSRQREVLIAPGERKNLTLKLIPQAIISGRVLDEDGDPVIDANVSLLRMIGADKKPVKVDWSEVNGEGVFTFVEVPTRAAGVPQSLSLVADDGPDFTARIDKGEFVFTNVPPGSYTLRTTGRLVQGTKKRVSIPAHLPNSLSARPWMSIVASTTSSRNSLLPWI